MEAHKVILAASSPFLRKFIRNANILMNKHSLSISSNQIDSFRQGYHLVADFPRNCRTDDGWLPYLQIMLPVSFISDVEREKYQILGSALGSAFVNLV